MLSEEQILSKLDNFRLGYYCQFLDLGNPSSFLIDCRLNIFLGDNDQWAIAGERLGYNQQAGGILLDICYHGNCLVNLEHYNGQDINYYTVTPVNWDKFNATTDVITIKPHSDFWIVRDTEIKLNHDKLAYVEAGIELREFEPNTIRVEEAARLAVLENRNAFRATDEELYKSLPPGLKKILVIDEWYHRDFNELVRPKISEEQLNQLINVNKLIQEKLMLDEGKLGDLIRKQEERNEEWNQRQWEDNRPSSYETWQQIAKVIATGNVLHYRPTLKSNSHWKNWPDSGSL